MANVPEFARAHRDIVGAAYSIVSEHGHRALTMAGVAGAAGVDVATVLDHFPDMDTLLIAVLVRRDEIALDYYQSLGPGNITAREIYHDTIKRIKGNVKATQAFAMLEAEALDPAHPAHVYFRERAERGAANLVPYLEQEFEDADTLSRRIWAVMDGVQLHYLRDRNGFDIDRHWNAIIEPLLESARKTKAVA